MPEPGRPCVTRTTRWRNCLLSTTPWHSMTADTMDALEHHGNATHTPSAIHMQAARGHPGGKELWRAKECVDRSCRCIHNRDVNAGKNFINLATWFLRYVDDPRLGPLPPCFVRARHVGGVAACQLAAVARHRATQTPAAAWPGGKELTKNIRDAAASFEAADEAAAREFDEHADSVYARRLSVMQRCGVGDELCDPDKADHDKVEQLFVFEPQKAALEDGGRGAVEAFGALVVAWRLGESSRILKRRQQLLRPRPQTDGQEPAASIAARADQQQLAPDALIHFVAEVERIAALYSTCPASDPDVTHSIWRGLRRQQQDSAASAQPRCQVDLRGELGQRGSVDGPVPKRCGRVAASQEELQLAGWCGSVLPSRWTSQLSGARLELRGLLREAYQEKRGNSESVWALWGAWHRHAQVTSRRTEIVVKEMLAAAKNKRQRS